MNMYPHQEVMLDALKLGKNYVVAKPRTGKTRPVVALTAGRDVKTLVLTKKAAVQGWLDEIQAMHLPGSWTVTNYEQIRTKKWDFDIAWDHLVCDEAHTLATFPKPNKLAPLVSRIITSCRRIGVSATPSPESYGQLFHQAKALKLGIWTQYKDFYAWHRAYGIPDKIYMHGRKCETYRSYKEKAWEEFASRCVILDRKEAVADFVEAHDVPVPIVDQNLLDLHHKLEDDRVIYVGDDIFVGESRLSLDRKVHQLCSGTIINDEGQAAVLSDARVRWLEETFRDSRIAVLTQFKEEVRLINRICSSVAIVDDPRAFQMGTGKWFVGNIQSYARGVDLSCAEAIVFFSLPWSAETYIQARERCLRRDRIKPAPVYFPFLKGGMDEQIFNRVAVEKKNFNSKIYEKLR